MRRCPVGFKRVAALALIVVAGLAATACTGPQTRRLKRFEQTLAGQDSATAALRQWCAAEHIADPSLIVAVPVRDAVRAEPADLRAVLAVSGDEPLGYRHVRLMCGEMVLSEAHNWYVPGRLTPAMNAALAATDTPFGTVAAPLGFRRERLASLRGPSPDCPPETVLAHHALLRLPDGQPLAFLVECYTAANLARPG